MSEEVLDKIIGAIIWILVGVAGVVILSWIF